ncbi:MAG: MotA/TolQ/ExbB proton channel family protein [Elusimicrobiota bacterium]
MKTILMSLALTGGDWVIWALIAGSIAAVAVIYDRFKLLRDERAALASLRAPVLAAIDSGSHDAMEKVLSAHPGFASRALAEGLAHLPRGPQAAAEHFAAALSDERRHLEHRLLWLGTLGNNAPFVGLFGTVLGVIKAFHDLAQSGAGPEVVMSGLSEALVATAVGLLVAIPSVLAFNIFSKWVRDLLAEAEALGRRLGAQAHGGQRRR